MHPSVCFYAVLCPDTGCVIVSVCWSCQMLWSSREREGEGLPRAQRHRSARDNYVQYVRHAHTQLLHQYVSMSVCMSLVFLRWYQAESLMCVLLCRGKNSGRGRGASTRVKGQTVLVLNHSMFFCEMWWKSAWDEKINGRGKKKTKYLLLFCVILNNFTYLTLKLKMLPCQEIKGEILCGTANKSYTSETWQEAQDSALFWIFSLLFVRDHKPERNYWLNI